MARKLLTRDEIAERIGDICAVSTVATHIRKLGLKPADYRKSLSGRGRPQPLFTLDDVAAIRTSVKDGLERKFGGKRGGAKDADTTTTATYSDPVAAGFGGGC